MSRQLKGFNGEVRSLISWCRSRYNVHNLSYNVVKQRIWKWKLTDLRYLLGLPFRVQCKNRYSDQQIRQIAANPFLSRKDVAEITNKSDRQLRRILG